MPINSSTESSRTVRRTYAAFSALICAWILAWMVKVYLLDPHTEWLTISGGSFIYWTIAKVLIWVLPALWLIRSSHRSLREVLNFSNWKGWLGWGGGLGFVIALINFIPRYLRGNHILSTEFSIPLLNVLAIAPIFEELLMRGAILGGLRRGYSFWAANIVSALMFVVLHLPGWYFIGTLVENLKRPVGGAFSIFLLGLAFGYVVHRSRSVIAGMLAHFLNNLS